MNITRPQAFLAILSILFWAGGSVLADHHASLESVPFTERSGNLDAMGFTLIAPEVSGVQNENPYDDPAMWNRLYTEFSGGSIGTGVAVGDVDGDGWVDLFVSNKTRPNQLFRQVAPFEFEDVTDQAGVAGPVGTDGTGWKTGATLADVNNDGSLDLYVCRFNAPNLLYLNDGAGRFTEAADPAGLALVSGSVIGAFEDFDRDGWLDVFVVTNVLDAKASQNGEVNRLYRNQGDGTFVDVSATAGISDLPAHSHSANWFDENGDGWADLYVANDFSEPDFLYRNNGDGTFTNVVASTLPHTPWFSMGSDAADINNDGRFDFIVADMAGTTHFKSKVTMGDMGGLVDYMDMLVTPQVHEERGLRELGHGSLLGSGQDDRHEQHRLDLVAPLRGSGQRRMGRPARHQRHGPEFHRFRSAQRDEDPADTAGTGCPHGGQPSPGGNQPRLQE